MLLFEFRGKERKKKKKKNLRTFLKGDFSFINKK